MNYFVYWLSRSTAKATKRSSLLGTARPACLDTHLQPVQEGVSGNFAIFALKRILGNTHTVYSIRRVTSTVISGLSDGNDG